MKLLVVVGIIVSIHLTALGGEPIRSVFMKPAEPQERVLLTGNLRIDFFSHDIYLEDGPVYSSATSSGQIAEKSVIGRKSSLLAAGLSVAVPGLGEMYSKSYLKSAIFLGAEVASWIIYGVYTKKGNDQTDEYEAFANVNWSVVDYSLWMNQNKNCFIVVDPNTSLPPHQRVNLVELNACERSVQGFSHILPPYDTQQYYELIGKYAQYTPGWNDADPTIDYALPENLDRVSPRFRFYRDMRGDANHFFNIASTALGVVVANHVLSALDAAWSASRHNRSLRASAQLRIYRVGEIREVVPTIDVGLRF